MRTICLAILVLFVATLAPAEEITYPVPREVADTMQWISVGLFAGWMAGMIVMAALAPRPTVWMLVDGEYVRVR